MVASARHAKPTFMLGMLSIGFIVSIRLPSSDHGRYTMSDKIATPRSLATRLRTASIDLVFKETLGSKPCRCQYRRAESAASSTVSYTHLTLPTNREV